ncbi:hypothetical protein [Microbulbifer taiwanensis]|uniref:hypothetical protein n=1 Tax=Microbulbifer taiwanensis TaxID=986746 RepID=UPI003619E69E
MTAVIFLLPLICLAQAPIELDAGEDGRKLTGLAEVWHDAQGTADLEMAQEAFAQGNSGHWTVPARPVCSRAPTGRTLPSGIAPIPP